MNWVRYKRGELPPLTEARKAELQVLADRPDSEIDYSDIPPLNEHFWARVAPIDADVTAWFQSQDKGDHRG